MKTFVIGDIHGRCAQLLSLLEMIPREESSDTLVFLGDLIDRGPDAPGCVAHVLKLSRSNPEHVICLRGNHEQMLLDFIEGTSNIWITPVTGGERTFEQYAGQTLVIDSEMDHRGSPAYHREQDSAGAFGVFPRATLLSRRRIRVLCSCGTGSREAPQRDFAAVTALVERHGFL